MCQDAGKRTSCCGQNPIDLRTSTKSLGTLRPKTEISPGNEACQVDMDFMIFHSNFCPPKKRGSHGPCLWLELSNRKSPTWWWICRHHCGPAKQRFRLETWRKWLTGWQRDREKRWKKTTCEKGSKGNKMVDTSTSTSKNQRYNSKHICRKFFRIKMHDQIHPIHCSNLFGVNTSEIDAQFLDPGFWRLSKSHNSILSNNNIPKRQWSFSNHSQDKLGTSIRFQPISCSECSVPSFIHLDTSLWKDLCHHSAINLMHTPSGNKLYLTSFPFSPSKKKAGHNVTKDNGRDIKNIGNQKVGISVGLLSKLQLSLCGWKFWGHRRLDQRVAPLDRQSFVHRATACNNWKSMSVVVNWAFTTFYDKFKASMGILSSRNMTKSRRKVTLSTCILLWFNITHTCSVIAASVYRTFGKGLLTAGSVHVSSGQIVTSFHQVLSDPEIRGFHRISRNLSYLLGWGTVTSL